MGLIGRCVKPFIAVALLALLQACATTRHEGPLFTEAPAPAAGEALVYVYRGHAPPYYFSPAISFDAVKVVDLANKGYTHVYVKPGEYTIRSEWPAIAAAPKLAAQFAFAGGQTYFLRLGGGMEFGSKFQVTTTRSSLFNIPAAVGRQEIAECMLVRPEVERIQ
jgi:hypothetical protein